MTYNMFSSTFNNQSLFTKSRSALLLHIGKERRMKNEEIVSLFFFRKIGFDISCKLYPLETVHMKCHILFYGIIRKILLICHLLNPLTAW